MATLLANDTDVDGDPLTLISVGPTSTEGGTVVSANGWVFYTPPPGAASPDSFTYLVSDSSGMQSTGSVAITLSQDTGVWENIVAIQALGNNASRIVWQGILGRLYTIQYTESLPTPAWQGLGTGTADETGRFEFTDTPGNAAPTRTYRSAYP